MFRSAAAASAGSPHRSGLVATQVTQPQICSPDPDLADPPTPLTIGAGCAAAAAWRRCDHCDSRSGREGGSTETLKQEVGTARHEGGEHGGQWAERLFAKAVESELTQALVLFGFSLRRALSLSSWLLDKPPCNGAQ
jgi:hypothetical protein